MIPGVEDNTRYQRGGADEVKSRLSTLLVKVNY